MTNYDKDAVDKTSQHQPNPLAKEAKLIHALLKGNK